MPTLPMRAYDSEALEQLSVASSDSTVPESSAVILDERDEDALRGHGT